jgi:uncharacterized membrane protein YkvA (DUF1232 family)
MLYIFSPVQLIPTFIPVIGQLDDLAVLWLGMRYLRRFAPAHVLAQCEAQAELTSSRKARNVQPIIHMEASRSTCASNTDTPVCL